MIQEHNNSEIDETETCRHTTTITRPEVLSSRTGCEKSRKRRRTKFGRQQVWCANDNADFSSPTTNTDFATTLLPIYNVVRCCSSVLQRLQPSQLPTSLDCQRKVHNDRVTFQQQRRQPQNLHQHQNQNHQHHHQHIVRHQHQHHYHQIVHQEHRHQNYHNTGNCCVSANSVLPLIFAVVLLLSVVTNTRWPAVMANPVLPTSSVPKWINPCNYDLDSRSGESSAGSSSSTDGAGGVDFQSAEARTLYEQIVSEVESTETYVNEIKHKFVEETFGDPSFIEEFEWISYEWLPKIPSAIADNFDTVEVSLKNSFEYLQHFAVAIEQMTMDQMIYEGSHLDQFRTMEKRLRNVLCLLQGAMLRLRVNANPDVTRGVMSEEYRSIEMDAMRNVRDYIIMREYAHALKFIHQAFDYFQSVQDASEDS